MTSLPAHSPLGGSGAARWMACPGSVSMAEGIHDEEDDTFSRPGSAAHCLAAYCILAQSEAWTFIGQGIEPDREHFYPADSNEVSTNKRLVIVDKEMADAVQMYLDAIREAYPDRHLLKCTSSQAVSENFW